MTHRTTSSPNPIEETAKGLPIDVSKSASLSVAQMCRYAEKQVGYMACAILLNEVSSSLIVQPIIYHISYIAW
jgi:hypothetical protein